jgi:hypothetical protein
MHDGDASVLVGEEDLLGWENGNDPGPRAPRIGNPAAKHGIFERAARGTVFTIGRGQKTELVRLDSEDGMNKPILRREFL